MIVLLGYSVAGMQIVVVVRSGRMSLYGQPRVIASSLHDSGGPSGDTWGGRQFVSGAQLLIYTVSGGTVDILCYCELPEL